MDPHPETVRVQFFIKGPFDPLESVSLTWLDSEWDVVAMKVEGAPMAASELWGHVAACCSIREAQRGIQLGLF